MRSSSSTCTRRKESPKYEAAAMKWLRRYLEESSPTLEQFEKVVLSLAKRQQRT
jgi:hypothetical protein